MQLGIDRMALGDAYVLKSWRRSNYLRSLLHFVVYLSVQFWLFSIRPFVVKRLQVTNFILSLAGPLFIFGIGHWPSQHRIRRRRRNSLTRVLTAAYGGRHKSPKRTRLFHRPARDIITLDSG